MDNTFRFGRFTSSEIWRLCKEGKAKGSFGIPALSYIEEVRLERNLGRSIDVETMAKPLTWGKLCEPFAFNKLGIEYSLCSDVTIIHPDISCYAGSPDAIKDIDSVRTVADLKCPMTLKSFCQLVDPLLKLSGMDAMNKIRDTHPDGEKYYQQICSNSILTKSKFGELIVFCPMKGDLEAIRESIQQMPPEEMKKYAWVNFASDDELPYLIEGVGRYQSLNVLRFEVPNKDKEDLIDRILRAEREYLANAD